MEYRNHCVKLTKSISKERIRMERELASKANNYPKLTHKYITKWMLKSKLEPLKTTKVC